MAAEPEAVDAVTEIAGVLAVGEVVVPEEADDFLWVFLFYDVFVNSVEVDIAFYGEDEYFGVGGIDKLVELFCVPSAEEPYYLSYYIEGI